MLTIFVPEVTPRLRYVFQLIFNDLLGVEFDFCLDKSVFNSILTPKFSYQLKDFNQGLFFCATSLLFKSNIEKQQIDIKNYNDLPAFFFHNSVDAALPFDPFAASFYLVSRYEEYLEADRDQHGRFTAQSSLAFQHQFLDKPLVNYWALEIQKMLHAQFPSLIFKKPSFKFTPTYDIDHAWAFKYKGLIRTTSNLLKCLLSLDFDQLLFRWAVLTNKKKDPFFTFPHLEKLFSKYNTHPVFFFLVGKYGIYDKNVSLKVDSFQKLIKDLSVKFQIGIHPSYNSHVNKKIINSELLKLSNVTAKTIHSSRQHFLLLEFPNTYQLLNELNIKYDYTMGYASETGFRASIAHPFKWYDLSKEQTTNLTVFPFQVMDVTLRHYKKLTPAQAKNQIAVLHAETQKVGGHFITLWHNNSLSEYEDWVGWRSVHDYIFELE